MEQQERRIDPKAIPILFSLKGLDINQKTDDGETMLHIAVRMRDKEVASVLVEAGGDVNIKDDEGNTPLSSAIDIGSLELTQLLLNHNPDFNLSIIRNKFYTCLLNSSSDDEKTIRLMLKYGFTAKETDDIDSTTIWSAISLGLEEFAISLVNFQKKYIKHVQLWHQSFLLHTRPFNAIQTEMLRIIQKILNLYEEEQEIKSTGNHNLDLFKLLLAEHDIELFNVNVLSLAGNLNDDEESDIVAITKDVLISCYDGESPVCDKEGRTGLHYAAKVGNVAVIQALLDIHLDINAKDNDGKTPLDYITDRIHEISHNDKSDDSNDINNDVEFNRKKHHDEEFNCKFTLFDLKVGAVLLLKHVSKLITADSYITIGNLKTVKQLLIMMNKDTVITQYYLSIYAFIEQCENEIQLMKSKKLVELSYYDFLTKNYNQIALYTKRNEVIEVLESTNNIHQEFKIYGPMLQHRFYISKFRRGLLENAESILFDIMKSLFSLVIVREVLSNLSNNELLFMVLNV